jgi:hypothetical protein
MEKAGTANIYCPSKLYIILGCLYYLQMGIKRLAFLFGSGISFKSEMPSVGQITEDLLDKPWKSHTNSVEKIKNATAHIWLNLRYSHVRKNSFASLANRSVDLIPPQNFLLGQVLRKPLMERDFMVKYLLNLEKGFPAIEHWCVLVMVGAIKELTSV